MHSANPDLIRAVGGSSFETYLSFGLHMGWTIEGVIGSESKSDACYLSPHLQIAYRVEQLCSYYDEQILLTESLYNLMSLKARNTLRKIDVVVMNEMNKDPKGLYTFDLSHENMKLPPNIEDHLVGDLIKLQEYESINIESFKNKGVDYMFTLDADIVGLQDHVQEFAPLFRLAFKHYISGDWDSASKEADRCLDLWETDGPTRALSKLFVRHQCKPPEPWMGYRDIDKVYLEAEHESVEEQEPEEQELIPLGAHMNIMQVTQLAQEHRDISSA